MHIDWWTLGLEAVNVAVLIWLLGRFFWRPVAAIIEKRQAVAAAMLGEAEARRKELDDAEKKIADTRAGFAAEREAILATAREDGERQRAAALERARGEAAEIEEAARRAAEAAREEQEKAWADRSSRLAVEIAGRLSARLAGPAVLSCFLDWLLKTIADLPDAARDSVRAGVPLAAVTASDPTPEEKKMIADAIVRAFGGSPVLSFETDPGLIAGIELRGPHFTLANSWRADLDRVRKELGRAS